MLVLTWARCDCLLVSFRLGRCDENCDTSTDLLLVTDLASFANFDSPKHKPQGCLTNKGNLEDVDMNKRADLGEILNDWVSRKVNPRFQRRHL